MPRHAAFVQVYDSIVPVDLKTMKVGSSIWTKDDGITKIAVLSGGTQVLVGDWMPAGESSLYFVDPQTAQTVHTVTKLGTSLSTFALSRDEAFAYCISKWGDDLKIISLGSSPSLHKSISLPFHAVDLGVTHDNTELIVHGGRSLTRYPLAGGLPQTPGETITLSCAQMPGENVWLPLAIDADDRLAVAACHGEPRVAVVDLEVGKESWVKTLAPDSGQYTKALGAEIHAVPK